MTKQSIIQLNHICAAYERKKVLEDINLTVYEKDFLGVIGPNGGGKTTLIKIILGLLHPISGDIRFYTGIHCPCLQGKFICTQCHGRRAKYTGFLHRLPQRKRLLPDGSGNGTEPRLLRPLPHAGPDALRGEA